MAGQAPYVVEPMVLSDLDQVMEIERMVFSAPWSRRAYQYEIAENEYSTMLVVRPRSRFDGGFRRLLKHLKKPGPVLGYAGMWLLVDEFHISTIAVHPHWRGRGLGEFLLISLLDRAPVLGASRATLEVRVSNLVAQRLYQKYGFEVVSRQARYYADNNEDAFIMVTPSFDSAPFQANLRQARAKLTERLISLE
jgi:ribosomal-protein-alanine N-acetyltransferase